MRRKNFGILEFLNSKWFIEPKAAENYLPLVMSMVQNPMVMEDDDEDSDSDSIQNYASVYSGLYGISSYGEAAPPEKAPKDSIAVLSFDGAITKGDQWCGDSGTVTKAELLRRCFANPNIKGVAIHMTSPGGSGNAIEAFKSAMSERNKPVVAYIDEMAASAGYWIASMADEIVILNNRAEVGSIGSYVTLANWDGYYEKLGLKVQRIYSSYSTEKNRSVEEALKGDTKMLIEELDKFTEFFFEDVKSGRSVLAEPKDSKIFKGAMYYGDQAVSNGMADHIGGWDVVEQRIEALQTNYKGGFYV